MDNLLINKEEYIKLKQAYQNAVDNKLETFMFQDREFVTQYAKYLIEYITNTDEYYEKL